MVKLDGKGGAAVQEVLSDLTKEEKDIVEKAVGVRVEGEGEEEVVKLSSPVKVKVKLTAHVMQSEAWCFIFGHKGIDPKNKYMRYWDIYTICLLVYTAIVTPYEVSFLEPSLNVLFWVNRFVDLSFLFDMVLNFYMGFFDDLQGKWVYDLRIIRKKYLESWFFVDVVSILPFDAIGLLAHSGSVKRLKVLRIVRLLRLAKLLRILRASRIFQRIESAMAIDYTTLDMVKYLTIVTLTSHWMACAFSLTQSIEAVPGSWMHRAYPDVEDPRASIHHGTLYIMSLYWSVMTATTIGYGDVVPSTDSERLITTLCMLIGGFMFGYIIGAVGNVITSRNVRHADFCSEMLHLNHFLNEGRFDAPLKQKLREFFKWRHTLPDASTNAGLLNRMSPSLRGASIKALDMWIDNVKILSSCPGDFVTHAMMRMERAHYPPGEVIVEAGSYDNAMYIVKQGLVVLGSETGGSILKTGGVWGEEMLYQRPPRLNRGDYRPSSRKSHKAPGDKNKENTNNQTGDKKIRAGGSVLAIRAFQDAASTTEREGKIRPGILSDANDTAMDLAVYGLVKYSAHSLTYCELYTLTSRQVADLVSQFPEAKRVFRRAAICRIAREELFAYTAAYKLLEEETKEEKRVGKRPEAITPSARREKSFKGGSFLAFSAFAAEDRVDHYYWKLTAVEAFNRENQAKLEAAVIKLQRRYKRWRVRARLMGMLPSQQREKLRQLEVTLENTPRVVFQTKAEMDKLKPRVEEMSQRLDQVAKQQEEILKLLLRNNNNNSNTGRQPP